MFKKKQIPYRLKTAITLRDKGICQNCGKQGKIKPRFGCYLLAYERIDGRDVVFEIGHLIPESKNGKTILENLILLCRYCNRSLGANIFEK